MRESRFQSELIRKLKMMFEGCIVLKNDASYIQGIPDLLILFDDRWAALECKASFNARQQANQEYYIDLMDAMSFAAFISPENEEEVLRALQQSFRPNRSARFS